MPFLFLNSVVYHMEGPPKVPKEVYDPPREKTPIPRNIITRPHDEKPTPEEAQIITQIEDLFAKEVWTWKFLSLKLPPTAFITDGKTSEDLFSRYVLDTNFDELDEVARDEADGKQKYLSKEQRHELWATGTFSVQSKKFPDQKHVWKITPLLIAGVDNIRNSWLKGLAQTVNQFTIQTPARLFNVSENSFSIIGGLRYAVRAFGDIFGLLIGTPNTYPKYGDTSDATQDVLKLMLFKELVEDPIMSGVYKAKSDPSLVFHLRPWIHHHKTLNKIAHAFSRVDDKWGYQRRVEGKRLYEKYVSELPVVENETEAARNERLHVVKVRVADELVAQYTELIVQELRKEFPNPDDAEAIIRHFYVIREVLMVSATVNAEMARQVQEYADKLKRDYPVRGRISSWYNKNVQRETDRLALVNKWTVHERLLKIFAEKGWKQQSFLLNFFLTKIREQKLPQAVNKELKKVKVPVHTFYWNRYIWRPKNWKVTRGEYGKYYATKIETTETNSKQWFWVWRNYFKRISTWWSNSLIMLVYSMLNSTFGLKALFYNKSFYPMWELNENTGEIQRDMSYKVLTFSERIRAIWTSVRQSRAKFEAEPDTGFLGKTFVRQLNRFWNYVMKGFLGTTVWTLIQPTVTVANFLVSLVSILTSVAWVPSVVTVVQLFRFIFFEPYFNRQRYFPLIGLLLKIVLGGLSRSVLAAAAALVAHPVAGVAITVGHSVKAFIRYVYDFVVYGLIIKPRARIPMQNISFVARRIQGPGLSSGYFMQISPEDALLGVTVRLEQLELSYFEAAMQLFINEPAKNLQHIVDRVFGVFGMQLGYDSKMQSKVQENTSKFVNTLYEMLSMRRSKLPNISRDVIRLTKTDLTAALNLAEPTVVEYVQSRVFPFFTTAGEVATFWSSFDLAPNDWFALTKKLMQEAFGDSIMQPLEEQDKNFAIQVKKMNLTGFVGMIKRAEVKDHLENVAIRFDEYREDEVVSSVPQFSAHDWHAAALTPEDSVTPLHKAMKVLQEWANKDEDYNKYLRPLA